MSAMPLGLLGHRLNVSDLDRALQTLLPLEAVLFMEPWAARAQVCSKTRHAGFTRVYEAFRGKMKGTTRIGLDNASVEVSAARWMERRQRFVSKQIRIGIYRDEFGIDGTPWWKSGRPSRRHIALTMWASSPQPERLLGWINSQDTDLLRVWRSNPCPF